MPDQAENTQVKWPGLFVLAAAAVGGLFWLRAPLHSSRPASSQYREARAMGDQVVDARLWQDPFEAVAAYRKSQKAALGSEVITVPNQPSSHTIDKVVAQVCRRWTNTTDTPHQVLVSLQMVSGGPYLEDAETRLRARNAVISALGMAGYVPWDEEHIDFFTNPWPRGTALDGPWTNLVRTSTDRTTATVPLAIPFEWFQPDELYVVKKGRVPPTNHVLVCWLPREAFGDHPFKRLAQLMEPLQRASKDSGNSTHLRVQLFDPNLHDLLSDLQVAGISPQPSKAAENACGDGVLAGLEIYSSWSTSPDALLATNATEVRRENIERLFASNHMVFRNVTATDDQLAEKVLEELELRGVDLQAGKASVALISEWDTYYGRALPLSFAAKLVQRQRVASADGETNLAGIFHELCKNITPWPTNILRFTYLRGVDGKFPGSEPADKTAAGKAPTKSRGEEVQEFERPEGCSQLDYIPRLAGELIERDLEARRAGKPRLRAIGVLGSDVYDKLLLIQALRNRLPGVLFFTVDLDARLYHPSELDWSRNLIIASSFDLELERELQDPIPPFRDTYQTGRFLSGLLALGQVSDENLKAIQPQVFEVGYHGAYVLGIEGEAGDAAHLYSGRPPPLTRTTILLAGAAVVMAFALVVIFNPRIRDWLAGRPEAGVSVPRWIVLGVVVLVAGFLGLIWLDHAQAKGEPFSLFEGISVWPAELIRLAAVFVGLGLLARGIRELKATRASLNRQFLLGSKDVAQGALLTQGEKQEFRDSRPWMSSKVAFMLAPVIVWLPKKLQTHKEPINVQELWHHYERWGLLDHSLWRVAPAMLGFFLLAIILMVLFGFPLVPYRGGVSKCTDIVVLAVGVLIEVFLTFFAVDAVRTCRFFIKELCARATVWPSDLLKAHASKRNIDRKYLNEWLDLDFVSRLTRAVGKFIYVPFIMLTLMILSRNTYFDRWDWPLSLVVVLGIISVYALSCAISLRRAAEGARRLELNRLKEKLVAAISEKDNRSSEQIRETIKEIELLREGAFAPITQQPFFRAILLILGGASSLPLAGFVPGLLGLTQ